MFKNLRFLNLLFVTVLLACAWWILDAPPESLTQEEEVRKLQMQLKLSEFGIPTLVGTDDLGIPVYADERLAELQANYDVDDQE